jgi:hypothetical protein
LLEFCDRAARGGGDRKRAWCMVRVKR